MNNRYQDLAREAGLLVHNPERMPTKLQRFAELLIRECAEIADKAEPYQATNWGSNQV